jgi:hypothetical protein
MKVESFLQEKLQAGLWDSTDSFSVACDKALSKTAAYSFSEPE